MPEPEKVRDVFSAIAPKYDAANRVISCGMDLRWRAEVVRRVAARKPGAVLDIATGSGDLALALRRALPPECSVTGLDFCEDMLKVARAKQARLPWARDVVFARGDGTALELPDASVDVVTVAWGIRNFSDRAKGLSEMRRVLKEGGALYCLEFSQPYRWIRGPSYLYLKRVMPLLARIVTGRRDSYEYLVGTVSTFPGREEFAGEMRAAGFSRVRALPRFFSSVAIHEAVK